MEPYGINRRYEHLLHDVHHDLFVKKDIWRNEWVVNPRRTDTYISVWIDSYRQYYLLTPVERHKTEAAFRHGYQDGLKTIQVKLQQFPEYLLEFHDDPEGKADYHMKGNMAVNVLYNEMELAKDACTMNQWRHMAALRQPDRTVGQVVYPVGHWLRAAYLRGIHFALIHLAAEWNDLVKKHGDEKRCLHTYLMETTLPLLLVDADQCLEYAIPISLSFIDEPQPEKHDCPTLLMTDTRSPT